MVVGRRATLEEDLAKAEAAREVETSRLNSLSERVKKTIAAKKEAESEMAKMKSAILALEKDLKVHQDSLDEFVGVSRSFKDMMLNELLKVRTRAVQDFLGSDSCKFLLESKYDEARQDGFDAAVGQFQRKGWIPSGCDLEAEGVSAFKEADGSDFAPEGVSDEDLHQCEFVELVCDETEDKKFDHGGPYLPQFVPRLLMSSVFVPLENHLEHNRDWLTLPGPVQGFDQDLDLMQRCPAFLKECQARRDRRLAQEAREREQAPPEGDIGGPSGTQADSSERWRE